DATFGEQDGERADDVAWQLSNVGGDLADRSVARTCEDAENRVCDPPERGRRAAHALPRGFRTPSAGCPRFGVRTRDERKEVFDEAVDEGSDGGFVGERHDRAPTIVFEIPALDRAGRSVY